MAKCTTKPKPTRKKHSKKYLDSFDAYLFRYIDGQLQKQSLELLKHLNVVRNLGTTKYKEPDWTMYFARFDSLLEGGVIEHPSKAWKLAVENIDKVQEEIRGVRLRLLWIFRHVFPKPNRKNPSDLDRRLLAAEKEFGK